MLAPVTHVLGCWLVDGSLTIATNPGLASGSKTRRTHHCADWINSSVSLIHRMEAVPRRELERVERRRLPMYAWERQARTESRVRGGDGSREAGASREPRRGPLGSLIGQGGIVPWPKPTGGWARQRNSLSARRSRARDTVKEAPSKRAEWARSASGLSFTREDGQFRRA